MKRKYLLSLKSTQEYSQHDDNSDILFTTEAEFEFQDGIYFIEYEESELTGLDNTKTSIEIGNDYVSVIRSGNVNSDMLFMNNKLTSSMYETKYGNLIIDIYTYDLQIDINSYGGKIFVNYKMNINDSVNSKNKMYLEIKEA